MYVCQQGKRLDMRFLNWISPNWICQIWVYQKLSKYKKIKQMGNVLTKDGQFHTEILGCIGIEKCAF